MSARYVVTVGDKFGPRSIDEYKTFPELLTRVRELRRTVDPSLGVERFQFANLDRADVDTDGLTWAESDELWSIVFPNVPTRPVPFESYSKAMHPTRSPEDVLIHPPVVPQTAPSDVLTPRPAANPDAAAQPGPGASPVSRRFHTGDKACQIKRIKNGAEGLLHHLRHEIDASRVGDMLAEARCIVNAVESLRARMDEERAAKVRP